MDAYHNEKNVLTKSGADRLHKSPAKYRAWRDGEIDEKETDALIDGRLLHLCTLQPDIFERDYFGLEEPKWGDCRKKENKSRRDQWRDEHPEWDSLNNLGSKYEYYKRISKRVRNHPIAAQILLQGEAEKEFRRELETQNGDIVTCKCRFDWIDENFTIVEDGEERQVVIAADLKFVREDYAANDRFWWMVREHRYYVQQAFYCKIKPIDYWYFIVVEKTIPFDMAVYRLPLNLEIAGDREVDEDLQLYADCKRENKWPGYPIKARELCDPRNIKR